MRSWKTYRSGNVRPRWGIGTVGPAARGKARLSRAPVTPSQRPRERWRAHAKSQGELNRLARRRIHRNRRDDPRVHRTGADEISAVFTKALGGRLTSLDVLLINSSCNHAKRMARGQSKHRRFTLWTNPKRTGSPPIVKITRPRSRWEMTSGCPPVTKGGHRH